MSTPASMTASDAAQTASAQTSARASTQAVQERSSAQTATQAALQSKSTARRLKRAAKKAGADHSVGSQSIGWTAVRYFLMLMVLCLVLIPVYVLIITSFKNGAEVSPTTAWALPETWDPSNWVNAWEALKGGLVRSLMLVIPSSIISAILGSMNGFVLSRWRFPGANIVFTLILFGMFIPYQAVMIPLMKIVVGAGSALGVSPFGIPALILMHVVYGIPICTLIFRNYYESVPNELIEAAKVDGAGMIRTYRSVVLPLSVTSFVVVIIWQFTQAWNDFLFALFFGGSSQSGPVTLALNELAHGSVMADYGGSMAGALIASAPTLIVYIFLGKYFVSGMMSGSVKG